MWERLYYRYFLIAVVILFVLSSLGTVDGAEILWSMKDKGIPDELQTYKDGLRLLLGRQYKKAEKKFQDLMISYPFSQKSMKGEVMLAYTYLLTKNYDNLVQTSENFINNYPFSNEYSVYMHYLKALGYYRQMLIRNRDNKSVLEAYMVMKGFLESFEYTDYAKDIDEKLLVVKDFLAKHEYEIGYFYYNNNNCIAAMNRFLGVLRKYPTRYSKPSLVGIIDCYKRIGNVGTAEQYTALYEYNYGSAYQ